jgi:hypothetical protein
MILILHGGSAMTGTFGQICLWMQWAVKPAVQ